MRYIAAVLISVVSFSGNAVADERIDSLKKMFTKMCTEVGANAPDAPKNPKQVAPYCQCTAESYWESVPKTERDELLSTGQSAGIQAKMESRMSSAQAKCKKTVGF